jgi:enoyl-CoA hydratase
VWHDNYPDLLFDEPSDGVLLITINRPERYNATDEVLHKQLEEVWRDISADPGVRVAVITGAGKAFSAGGEFSMVESSAQNFTASMKLMRAARELFNNMAQCETPIISAINGAAVGAGLSVALLADISIMAEEARFTDGHLRLGVAAGDHAAMLWPLLCGLAKARYFLLTSEFIDGREAERIGLVSRCVPRERLLDEALALAAKLAASPQPALRLTKRALNNWLQLAAPIFEASLGYEILTFMGDDVAEGVAAIRDKRPPVFTTSTGNGTVEGAVRGG